MSTTLKVFLTLVLSTQIIFASLTEVNYLVIQRSAAPLQIEKNKVHSGIITDIVSEILEGKVLLKTKAYPFKRMIRYMNEGNIKNWINYGAPEWQGPQSKRLSKNSLYETRSSILTLKNHSFSKLSDLFGKRVILINGFDYPGLQRYIDTQKIKTMYVEDYRSGIKALLKKRAFGLVGMERRVRYNLKLLGLKKASFKFHDFSKIIKNYKLYLSFAPSFPKKLIKYIDVKILEMKNSGRLDRIISQYTNE